MNENFTYVTTVEQLNAALPFLKQTSSVAVDVEFDNKFSYDVVICLIQLSTGKKTYLIDPLEVDPAPLQPIFEDPEIIKLFFAGIQDIQLLQTNYNWNVRSIVDLSTIYQVINDDQQQTSLNEVVKDVIGHKIPRNKQIQKKEDWKQRPLPVEMQLYAARDVIFLHKTLIKMQKQLEAKQQELLELYFLQVPLIVDQTENSLLYAFELCSRYNFKDEREKHLMFKLVQFREQTAELIDGSSGYILSRSILKTLVDNKPTSIHEMKQNNIYYSNVKKYAHEILEIIRTVYSKQEEPSDYFKMLQEKYTKYYPHYKYLNRQYEWPYEIDFTTYKSRRGSLRILKEMLTDRFGMDRINYLYTKYLNHQIARFEGINLFNLRQQIEIAESDKELIKVIYQVTETVYDLL